MQINQNPHWVQSIQQDLQGFQHQIGYLRNSIPWPQKEKKIIKSDLFRYFTRKNKTSRTKRTYVELLLFKMGSEELFLRLSSHFFWAGCWDLRTRSGHEREKTKTLNARLYSPKQFIDMDLCLTRVRVDGSRVKYSLFLEIKWDFAVWVGFFFLIFYFIYNTIGVG